MRKKSPTGIIGSIIITIILILIVIFSNVSEENFSYFEGVISKVIMPVQNSLTYLKNKIAKNNSFFEDIDKLKEENQELKNKNSELEQNLRKLEMVKAENEVLQEYSKMLNKYQEYETIPGYVINKDFSNFSNVIVINIGTNNGVMKNMAVISEAGLVGHVISVTDNTAKVQTIIDSASSVSATISTSRDTIICKGILEDSNKLKATYIPTDASLLQDDKVETSGMGGIYPKGILIGKIKEIKNTQNVTDRYAIVETAVNFSKLETVVVIK